MNRLHRYAFSALLAASVLFVAGCGGGSASAKGKVSFNGTPLSEGKIGFVPKSSSTGAAVNGSVKNGEYSIPATSGLSGGEYQVQITSSIRTGKKVGVPGDPGITTDEVIQFIPEIFNTKTTLTASLHSGENSVDFNITGTPATKGGTGTGGASRLKD